MKILLYSFLIYNPYLNFLYWYECFPFFFLSFVFTDYFTLAFQGNNTIIAISSTKLKILHFTKEDTWIFKNEIIEERKKEWLDAFIKKFSVRMQRIFNSTDWSYFFYYCDLRQHDMKTDEWIAKLDYLRWVL